MTRAQLLEAIRVYGEHTSFCEGMFPVRCDCGFMQVWSAVIQEQEYEQKKVSGEREKAISGGAQGS